MLKGKEEEKFWYCTEVSGVKTSAYLKHHGFQDVNQLHGGIIDYARQLKEDESLNNIILERILFLMKEEERGFRRCYKQLSSMWSTMIRM